MDLDICTVLFAHLVNVLYIRAGYMLGFATHF